MVGLVGTKAKEGYEVVNPSFIFSELTGRYLACNLGLVHGYGILVAPELMLAFRRKSWVCSDELAFHLAEPDSW